MTKTELKSWFVYILFLLVLLVSTSCRSVSKTKTESKETVKTSVDSLSSAAKSINKGSEAKLVFKKKDASKTIKTAFTVEPLNTEKPIEVVDSKGDTTKYFNAKLKKETEEVNSDISEEINLTEKDTFSENQNLQTDLKKEAETNKEGSYGVIERKRTFWSVLANNWWLILILIIALIWGFRKKIPYIKNFF